MKATHLLRQQHRLIERLFVKYERETDPERRARVVATLAEELIAHLAAERTVFHSAVRKYVPRSALRHARASHSPLRKQLRDVLAAPNGERAESAMRILANLFAAHAQNEETALYPLVERSMPIPVQEIVAQELSDARPPIWVIASDRTMRDMLFGPFRAKVTLAI